MIRHLHFGSTPNFPNLYKGIRNTVLWQESLRTGYCLTALILMPDPVMPTLTFKGSEKLHGENMAVCYSNGVMWVQGRNHIRTIVDDQNGMALFVESTKTQWLEIINSIETYDFVNTDTHTIVLDCEWAGESIQNGNAACSGTPKGAYLFDYYRVVSNEDDSVQLNSTNGFGSDEHRIFNMASFQQYVVTLDFNNPQECEHKLKELVELVEAKSPIAAHFNKPNNVGEGVYLYHIDDTAFTYRLKAKGELHGGKPKVKKGQKPTDDARAQLLTDLANKVTPVWRITQGILETTATEIKHLGSLIKWVVADIAKEEVPVLVEAGIAYKDLSRYVSTIVKDYFVEYLKSY